MNYIRHINYEFTHYLFNNDFEKAKNIFDKNSILYVVTGTLILPEKPINDMLLYACSHKTKETVIWLFDMLENVNIKDRDYDFKVWQSDFEYDYESFFMESIRMVNLEVSKHIYLKYIENDQEYIENNISNYNDLTIDIINNFVNKYLSSEKYTELYIYLLIISDIDRSKLEKIEKNTHNVWLIKQINKLTN